MHVEFRQVGGLRLDTVVRTLRTLDKPLQKEVYAGLTRAVKPLTAAVKREAAATLPHRGGYARLMAAQVRIRVNRRGGTAIRLVAAARGRREQRDVRRANAGELRHPVYGRRRLRLWTKTTPRRRIPGGQPIPNPWTTTAVRPGFVYRPVDRNGLTVRQELIAAVERAIAKT